jgi:tetratricopeptide (TPR) repeat protein
LEISRKLGDPRLLAYSLNGLGFVLCALDQPVEAGNLAEQAVSLAQQTGDRYDLADAYGLLGQVAGCLGQPDRAKALLLKSIGLLNEGGTAKELISGYARLGDLALSLDDTYEAEEYFRKAASIAVCVQTRVSIFGAIAGWANARYRNDDASSALELASFILHDPSVPAAPRAIAQQLRGDLEARLTPEQIAAIEDRTRGRTLEEILRRLLASPTIPE